MARDKIDLKRFREILLRERKRLQQQEERIERRSSTASEAAELGELADYDNHPADAASNTESRAMDIALDESINTMIAQIDEALRKIENGTYGVCDRCGSPINPERLEVLPYATLCIDCQDIVEEIG